MRGAWRRGTRNGGRRDCLWFDGIGFDGIGLDGSGLMARSGGAESAPFNAGRTKSSTFAVLVQRAAFKQFTKMLLQRVAAGPGRFDRPADGDVAMLAGELGDLKLQLKPLRRAWRAGRRMGAGSDHGKPLIFRRMDPLKARFFVVRAAFSTGKSAF